MARDAIALLSSFAYVFAAIGVAEGLRKWRGYSVEFTHKSIHIAANMRGAAGQSYEDQGIGNTRKAEIGARAEGAFHFWGKLYIRTTCVQKAPGS